MRRSVEATHRPAAGPRDDLGRQRVPLLQALVVHVDVGFAREQQPDRQRRPRSPWPLPEGDYVVHYLLADEYESAGSAGLSWATGGGSRWSQ